MKESLRITNAGPLRDIYIPEITPFTVLIGPSGAGKSMLMKVVILMRYVFKLCCIRSYLKDAGLPRSPFRIQADNLFRDDIKTHLLKEGVRIEYTVTFDSGNQFSAEFSDRTISVSVNGTRRKDIPSGDIVFTKESWISETRNVIPSWISNPANNKGWLGFYFHETLSDFSEATRNIRHLDLPFLDARITIETRNGVPRYLFEMPEKHLPIELRHASSGIQTAAPLAIITSYFARKFSFKDAKWRSIMRYLYENDNITFQPKKELADVPSVVNIHIEEPELSLDPVTQVKMVDYLVDTAFNRAENKMTLMLATHSPYIVNALNLVINRREGRASIPADWLSVYNIYDGRLINLKATTPSGGTIVNTADLTAPMEKILEDYMNLISSHR